MQYKIEIRPLATIEIIEAYDWYESQKEGLGLELLHELDVFYDSLLRNAEVYSFYEGTVREGKLHRFPYVVVYEIFDEVIAVFSVFMTSQYPSRKRSG